MLAIPRCAQCLQATAVRCDKVLLQWRDPEGVGDRPAFVADLRPNLIVVEEILGVGILAWQCCQDRCRVGLLDGKLVVRTCPGAGLPLMTTPAYGGSDVRRGRELGNSVRRRSARILSGRFDDGVVATRG